MNRTVTELLEQVNWDEISPAKYSELRRTLLRLIESHRRLADQLQELVQTVDYRLAEKVAEAELPPPEDRYLLASQTETAAGSTSFKAQMPYSRRFYSQLVTPELKQQLQEQLTKSSWWQEDIATGNRALSSKTLQRLAEKIGPSPAFRAKLRLLGRSDAVVFSDLVGTLREAYRQLVEQAVTAKEKNHGPDH